MLPRTSEHLTAQERDRLAHISQFLTRPHRTYPPPPLASPSQAAAAAEKMRVRIFCDWCTSNEVLHCLERQCESLLLPHYALTGVRHAAAASGEDGGGGKFTLTAGDDFTHAVVVNHAMPDLGALPRHRVLGLAQEPRPFLQIDSPVHRAYAARHIGRYLVGSLECPTRPNESPLGPPFERHDCHIWYSVPTSGPAPTLATKTHVISMMVSAKGFAPGHVYRHHLAERILQTHLPVHFFGNGCDRYRRRRLSYSHPHYDPATGTDRRVRGPFVDCDAMLNGYLFHVCIENFSAGLGAPVGEYYSEKVLDPLVRETVPVYLGSDAVERAFPGSTVALTGNVDADLAIIADLCQRPLDFLRRIDVAGVKRHANFLYQLPRLFQEMAAAAPPNDPPM